jgi:hypothetical protein
MISTKFFIFEKITVLTQNKKFFHKKKSKFYFLNLKKIMFIIFEEFTKCKTSTPSPKLKIPIPGYRACSKTETTRLRTNYFKT